MRFSQSAKVPILGGPVYKEFIYTIGIPTPDTDKFQYLAETAGLSLALSEIPKARFLVRRL